MDTTTLGCWGEIVAVSYMSFLVPHSQNNDYCKFKICIPFVLELYFVLSAHLNKLQVFFYKLINMVLSLSFVVNSVSSL